MSAAVPGTIVLDIGKTNAKLTLIDAAGGTLAERRTPNTVRRVGPYPHHDTERLWSWMLGQLRELAALADIRAIVPVTHGATAALIDDAGRHLLPRMDKLALARRLVAEIAARLA